MDNPIIVALDGMMMDRALSLAMALKDRVWGFKINDLWTRHHMQAVDALKPYGRVFVDAKFHDIPNTVKNHVESLEYMCHEDVSIATIHATGGVEMMKWAVQTAKGTPLKIAAVTVLTSLDLKNLQEMYETPLTVEMIVSRLAHMAEGAGVDYIVCSPKELNLVAVRQGMKCIVPGIRPAWHQKADDQKRTATPADARKGGATFMVIGRPITEAADPVKAAEDTLAEWEGAA
jgi:orotidine-5'-phosphate decarboxylase